MNLSPAISNASLIKPTDTIDVQKFFVRTQNGSFVESPEEIPFNQIETLLSLPISKRKICVEYCLQVIKAKKVVRLRMKYASLNTEGGGIRLQDAYFMMNASAPQFGGIGCGTFFSDTLEVNEIEQPPQFLMNMVQQCMMKMMMQ